MTAETQTTQSLELLEQYRTLIEVSKAISAHHDLHELFRDLAQRLPRVVPVNFVALSLHDPERNLMRLHTLQANVPADIVGGHEERVEEIPAGLVWQTQQPLLVPNLAEERRWPMVTQCMREDGINSFCEVPLTTALRRLGTMGFGSLEKEAYGEADVEFLQEVGNQVAVAVDNVLHHQDLTRDRDRLRLLLEVSEAIASHRDLEDLFRDLAQRLPQIVPFDYINAVLHEPARDVMRLWLLVTATPSTISPGLELPVDESPGGVVWKTQRPMTVNDVTQERRFPRLMAMLRENGVQSFCVVPLTTAQRRLGAMGFGSLQRRTYQEAEINFMQQVAHQVAVAVDNALHAESAQSAQRQLQYERDRVQLLLEVNNAVVSHLDLDDLFTAVSACLRRVIRHDGSSLVLYEPETRQYRVQVLDFTKNTSFIEEGQADPQCKGPSGVAINTRKPAVFTVQDLQSMASESKVCERLLGEGVKSLCSVPLLAHDRVRGALNVGRRSEDAFSLEDIGLLSEVAKQIALAVENAVAYKQIAQLRDKLTEEKLYLEEEIQTEYNFEEIVGDSRALKLVLKEVQTVAATDSTVLILGETGSGKELVARALHNRSHRRSEHSSSSIVPRFRRGCWKASSLDMKKARSPARLPPRSARFELADRGTIFLDEVGNSVGITSQVAPSAPRAGVRTPGQHQDDSCQCRASSPRPTAISVGWWRNRSFAATCITGSRSFRSPPSLARAHGRHSLAGPTLCSKIRPTNEKTHRDDPVRSDASASGLSVARQRAGAREFRRASGDSHPRTRSVCVTCRITAEAESHNQLWDYDP